MTRVSCVFAQEKSAAFFDQQLSEAETELILSHIEECKTCAAIFANMEQIEISPPKLRSQQLSLLSAPDFWDDMDSTISQAFDEHSRQKRRRGFDLIHVILAALVLLSMAWGWYQRSQRTGLELVIQAQQQELDRMHQRYIQVPTENIPTEPTIKPTAVRFDL